MVENNMVYADERGRITLGISVLSKFGRKFAIAKGKNEILLIPISQNPLKYLQNIGKTSSIKKYSPNELRKIALAEANQETK